MQKQNKPKLPRREKVKHIKDIPTLPPQAKVSGLSMFKRGGEEYGWVTERNGIIVYRSKSDPTRHKFIKDGKEIKATVKDVMV